jgi:hypothetical protein
MGAESTPVIPKLGEAEKPEFLFETPVPVGFRVHRFRGALE